MYLELMLSNSLYTNIYLLYGAHFTHTVTHQCNIIFIRDITVQSTWLKKPEKNKNLRAKGHIRCILNYACEVLHMR